MISPETLHSDNGAISPDTKTEEYVLKRSWLSSKFNQLYGLLFVLALVMLAVLVVVILLIYKLGHVETSVSAASAQIPQTMEKMMNTFKAQQSELLSQIIGLQQRANTIPGLEPVTAQVYGPTETRRAEPNTEHPWFDAGCEMKCERNDFTKTPLLILSFDGFKREYLDRAVMKTLPKFGHCGTTAERVFPVYPSKTFPNHYSIATGLYPESHGVVDNSLFDPTTSPKLIDMKSTKFESLYKGDPIWSSYKRLTGEKVACLFWPGCAYNVSGYKPDFNPPFNKNFPYRSRFAEVRGWLQKPEKERPKLIMLYIDDPDGAGHWQHDDKMVNDKLAELDSYLNEFLTNLHNDGILNCINFAIVSDHGMQKLKKNYYFNEIVNMNGTVSTNGVVAKIYRDGTSLTTDQITDKFACKHGEDFKVFTRETIAPRKHYSSKPIVGDVIVQGQPGVYFMLNKSQNWGMKGDHGYDYLNENMHTIFFARGPAIKKRNVVPAFQNIEYYNLWLSLLNIRDAVSTNGTSGTLDPVLEKVEEKPLPLPNIGECMFGLNPAQATNCGQCPENKINEASSRLLACSLDFISTNEHAPQFFAVSSNFCFQNFCNKTLSIGPITFLEERLHVDDNKPNSCEFYNARHLYRGCSSKSANSGYAYLSADVTSEFGRISQTRFEWSEGFIKNYIDPLNDLTMRYVRELQKIVVITGVAYDADRDGLADKAIGQQPTHLFRILLTCPEGWGTGSYCKNANDLMALPFLLPALDEDINCMKPEDLLLDYTAKIRDIELITGLQFTPRGMSREQTLRLRTHINLSLW